MLDEEKLNEETQQIQDNLLDIDLLLLYNIVRLLNMNNLDDNWQEETLLLTPLLKKWVKKDYIKKTKIIDNLIKSTVINNLQESLKKDEIIFKKLYKTKIIPPKYNKAINEAYKNAYKKYNLVNSKALNMAEKTFRDTVNNVYLQVSAGGKSYQQALEDACSKLAKTGVTRVNYDGKTDHADVAIKRMILTSTSQTAGKITLDRCKDYNHNLVEVSSHAGARPSHAKWQGKIYQLKGSGKYDNFYSSTGYGDITGLKGVNCSHDFYPFYEGLSEQTFKPYDEKENLRIYEQSQQQRKLERELRYEKRKQAAGLENKAEEKEKELSKFTKNTGRTRRINRENPL